MAAIKREEGVTYLSARVTVIWPFVTSFAAESSLVDATASFICNICRKWRLKLTCARATLCTFWRKGTSYTFASTCSRYATDCVKFHRIGESRARPAHDFKFY